MVFVARMYPVCCCCWFILLLCCSGLFMCFICLLIQMWPIHSEISNCVIKREEERCLERIALHNPKDDEKFGKREQRLSNTFTVSSIYSIICIQSICMEYPDDQMWQNVKCTSSMEFSYINQCVWSSNYSVKDEQEKITAKVFPCYSNFHLHQTVRAASFAHVWFTMNRELRSELIVRTFL